MSPGGRADTRRRMLRRAGVIAGVFVLLALMLLLSGHWVLGIVLVAASAAAIWLLLQLRTVR
jgi:hypothetical protein